MISNATGKLYFLIALAFLTSISPLHSQNEIECDDHLEFCHRGWNKLYMEQDPGPAVIYFRFGLGGSSSLSSFYEYPYWYFFSDLYVPRYGDYQFWSYTTSSEICSGTYVMNNCHDNLLYERENYCGIIFIFKPTDPHVINNNNNPYQVCLGDTTPIYLSPQSYQTTDLPNAPLTADRLKIKNGYLIDIKDYSAKIVWNAVGSDEVELITADECGFQRLTYQEFIVKDRNELEILTEDNSSELTVCVGESILLRSEIGEANSIVWTVSDGRSSSDLFLDLSFDLPGQYTVRLEDPDECNCSIIDVITVNVLAGESPKITCTSTICENTSVTYYSEDFCDSYIWSITGDGIVTDGGGPTDYFILIDWGAGPEGTVELETPGCYDSPCRQNVIADIPIIGSQSTIEGQAEACAGERYSYSVPNYAGTTYTWSVKNYYTGGSMGSFSGQGRHIISIEWATSFDEPVAIIEVDFENCTLGCSGRAEMLVNLLPPFSISANNSFACMEEEIRVVEENYLSLDFQVVSPSGGLTNYPGIPYIDFEGTEEGVYLITATNPNNTTCNLSEELQIVVSGTPELPSSISNSGLVCKGENSTFYIDDLSPNYSVHWKIYDGSLLEPELELTSKTLNYVWIRDEPYQVEAQLVDIQSGCMGESISEVFSTTIEIEGDYRICKLLEGNYTIDNTDDAQVLWSIIPESAGVITSKSNSELKVIWSEEGNHQIIAEACGKTDSYDVNVVNYILDLTYPDSVCVGELREVQVNAPAGSSIAYFDENDNLISNGAAAMLGKGEYSVVVNTPSGCIDGGEFSIAEFEEFEVFIFPDGPTAFCMPHPMINLISSAPPGIYTYEWYKDYALLPETSSTLATNEFGYYYLIATNEHGCQDQSNGILLSQCCGASFTNCFTNTIGIDVTDVDCFEKEFELTGTFDSDTIRWDFDDPASSSNYAYGNMVSHVFSGVGSYRVTVNGNKGCNEGSISVCGNEEPVICCEAGEVLIVIYTEADFEVEEACVDIPIEISNETKKISGYNGESYTWDFGDALSADNTSTEVEPSHIYSTAGMYMITLVVTDHLGCTSSEVKEVVIHPKPIVDLDIPEKGCLGIEVAFGTTTTFPNVKYRWNFGDENSGYYNKSKEANPIHIFAKQGTYTVSLEVESEKGCIEQYVQNVEILLENDIGQITATDGFYKCPGESLTLTAPAGKSYLWNTEEVSQSIVVTAPGEYKVVVETEAGCEYIPNRAVVSDIDLTQLQIFGATREDGVGAVLHFDSMNVCNHEYFVLEAQKYQDVIFTWSIGNIEAQSLSYVGDGLQFLDVGRHEVTVTARHSALGCAITLDPFIVNILELPSAPVIVSSTPDICIGGTTKLSVLDPLPDHIYVWNTGQIGTSIVATNAGNKYVFAYSPEGCRSELSNGLYVNHIPWESPWIGGCHEVCFPFTLCTKLYLSYDYELIRNETEVTIIDANSTEIILSEPGDYQLIAVSSSGCRTKSELLTLSATPEEQGLSGIVYFDENSNGTFEASDTLLEQIPVILCNGNTPIDTTITDVNGSYSFINLPYPNLITKIDLTNTKYAGGSSMDTMVIFSGCMEFKEVDFPVISECLSFVFEEAYFVCEGESIQIHGIDYTAGQRDTLLYPKEGNCDSIIYLSIDDFAIPEVTLEMSETCLNEQLGSIDINTSPGDSLLFRLDEDSDWQSDTLFSNLSEGFYELFILSKFGCVSNQTFEINSFPIPELEISTHPSCLDVNNGIVDFYTNSLGILYSIDGNSTFDTVSHIENLAIGMHTVDFIDEHGCLHQKSFEIESILAPEVNLNTVSTCLEMTEGSLTIEILQGQDLTFSIDEGMSFSAQTEFSNLSSGSYILDILDGNLCTYQLTFEVEQYPETTFEIETTPACDELETGSLIVYNPSDEMQYRIDDMDWSGDLFYEDLSVGPHYIYSQSSDGCLDTLLFDIELGETPVLNYEVLPGCEGIFGGALNIELIDSLMIALDDGEFGDQLAFSDISSGSHMIRVQNEFGCIFEYPFMVSEVAEPQLEIMTKASCFGDTNGSAELMLDDSDFELNVLGAQGEAVLDLDRMLPGEYSVIATNAHNCEYIYPFSIQEQEEPYLVATSENTCIGEAEGTITIEDKSANSLISLNGGEFMDVSSFENLATGKYQLEILDSLLCSSIFELEIEPFEELIINVPIESGGCFSNPVLVTPEIISYQGEVEYLWNDGSTHFEREINSTEKVSLIISDYCTSQTFEFDIEIASELTEELVYLPNVFSPNGDDVNDCFQVTIHPSISLATYRQIIFDRWGNKLFESNDIDHCWDGLFNGVALQDGVYVYIVEASGILCNGEKRIRKVGDVTIVK